MILSPAVRGAEAAVEAEAAAAEAAAAEAGGGSEAPPPCVLVEADQRAVRDGLASYYARVVASAQRAFTELRAVAKANQKVLGAKGELSDEAAAAYDRARKLHERLVTG
eukprot:scaffold45844_cov27-Phaeocystis_antarctica.AAC.1